MIKLVSDPDEFPQPDNPPEPKIVRLTGAKLSPDACLHMVLQHLHRVKSVTVVIGWDDDTFQVTWSNQPVSSLAMASLVLTNLATKSVMGDETDGDRFDPRDSPEPA